jgi:hypothetical protein
MVLSGCTDWWSNSVNYFWSVFINKNNERNFGGSEFINSNREQNFGRIESASTEISNDLRVYLINRRQRWQLGEGDV